MNKNKIRIFTYLPSPRVWKALIAADLCDIQLDLRADKPKNLSKWLWDFDARPLTEVSSQDEILVKGKKGFSNILKKTERFLSLNPFGNVPVAFNSKGTIGIFESNSILRLVARMGKNKINLYGKDDFIKSRVDSFLDSSLIFGTLSQPYLLALYSKKYLNKAAIEVAEEAYKSYMNGIETCLKLNENKFLISNDMTIADVCFFGEFFQFAIYSSRKSKFDHKQWFDIIRKYKKDYKKAHKLLEKLLKIKSFKKVAYKTLVKYNYYV